MLGSGLHPARWDAPLVPADVDLAPRRTACLDRDAALDTLRRGVPLWHAVSAKKRRHCLAASDASDASTVANVAANVAGSSRYGSARKCS